MRLGFVVLALALMGCANAASPVNAPVGGDPRSIAVRETKHGFVFVRGDGTELTEDEFRAAYRTDTGATDLDQELAAETMHKRGLFAVGMGVGSVALGTTAIALADCKTAMIPASCERGELYAGVLVAAGIYTLGCEAIKGPRCFTDGDVIVNKIAPSHLNREQASFYADRYNDALRGTKLEDNAPAPTSKGAALTLSPSGLSGKF